MQFRNAEHNDNQKEEFLTRDEFHHSSVKLGDSMMWLNRGGGGSLMWAFDGQGPACYGRGSLSQWTENNIGFSDYAATTNGGPYIDLNGTDEYLSIADAAWQEAGSNNLLVWAWFNSDDTALTQTIASKWDTALGNHRSWWVRVAGGTDLSIKFSTNPTGGGGANVDFTSSNQLSSGTWYFTAAYYQPSTLMRIFTAAATATSVTIESLTDSIPATLFDTDGALSVGGRSDGTQFFDGDIGIGLARVNVPATNINAHVARLFASSRWFYQE